jgi:hypothetical protein
MITEVAKLFQKPIVHKTGTLIKIERFIVAVGRFLTTIKAALHIN